MIKWFCFFKAYGDFIIACRFLREQQDDHYGMICGSYLWELVKAINFSRSIKWVDTGGKGVSALFDVKKRGIYEATYSALRIREAIHRETDKRDLLVFDRVSIKERIVSWPLSIGDIKMGEPNIYLDYARYFNYTFYGVGNQLQKKIKSVSIFPDARLIDKTFDTKLINLIISVCVESGVAVRVVRVGPLVTSLKNTMQESERINGFYALVKSISSSDAIISADSLPAHLAEYFDIPVFVFTPKRNDYWMPFSVFKNKNFSLFNNLDVLKLWLK